MVTILTTWIISSSNHRQNTTWEIHVVLSSPDSTLSHTGIVRFDITTLSFGIFCLFQWKIQTTSICLKTNITRWCYSKHCASLDVLLPAFPLYQIRALGAATMTYSFYQRIANSHIYSFFSRSYIWVYTTLFLSPCIQYWTAINVHVCFLFSFRCSDINLISILII